jgi:hypothetical protein
MYKGLDNKLTDQIMKQNKEERQLFEEKWEKLGREIRTPESASRSHAFQAC